MLVEKSSVMIINEHLFLLTLNSTSHGDLFIVLLV